MEQERPSGNHRVEVGAKAQGETGALKCKWPVGVGPSHSSAEACEGGDKLTSGWSEGEGRAGNLAEGEMAHTLMWQAICPQLRLV